MRQGYKLLLIPNFLLASTPGLNNDAMQKLVHVFVLILLILVVVMADIGIFKMVPKTNDQAGVRKDRIGVKVAIIVVSNCFVGWAVCYTWSAIDSLVGASGGLSFSTALLGWGAVALTAFALLNVAFFLVRQFFPASDMSAAMVFSIFWGIAAGVAVLLSIFFLYPTEPQNQVYAFIASVLGALFGWLLGMYITPQDSSERSQFARIGAAVAGLASGYTLKGVQDWAFGDGKPYDVYLLFGLICAAITTATIYNTRAYGTKSIRITIPPKMTYGDDKQTIVFKENATAIFKAVVTGEDDSSVVWSTVPAASPFGCIESNGKFTAKHDQTSETGFLKIKVESFANPRLIELVDVQVEKS